MAKITLHTDNKNLSTTVSNRFIDEYMTSANGEFVKIYLYLLRCMNSPDCSFSITQTADKFDHTEKDIQRALKYWEKMNLLHLEYDESKHISSIHFTNTIGSSQPTAEDTKPKTEIIMPKSSVPEKTIAEPNSPDITTPVKEFKMPQYSPNEFLRFREKEDVQEILFVAESYLGHPLTQSDIQHLLFWYDELSFSADVIIFLIEHVISKGHKSLRYMNKIALSWKDADVRTIEDARQNISSYSKIHYAVGKALGIQGRTLVSVEMEYVDKWSKEFGYGIDIISEACKRTILATHQPSFDYTDKILTNWHDQKVCLLEDIVKVDSQRQNEKKAAAVPKTNAPNKFNNFHQRAYNYEELEAQLLNSKN